MTNSHNNFARMSSSTVGASGTFLPRTCHSKILLPREDHSTDVLRNDAPWPHPECGHWNARRHTDL